MKIMIIRVKKKKDRGDSRKGVKEVRKNEAQKGKRSLTFSFVTVVCHNS